MRLGQVVVVSGGAGDPQVLAGTVDPSAGGGVAAAEGSFYMRYAAGSGQDWIKVGAAATAWIQIGSGGGKFLGSGFVASGAGTQTTLTICSNTQGFQRFNIYGHWVQADTPLTRRLLLDFNGGAITGSGYFRSTQNTAGTGSASGAVAAIAETAQDLITFSGYLDAPDATTKHWRHTANSGDAPFAAANLTIQAHVASWNSVVNITDMRVRSTTTAGVDDAAIGELSYFSVFGIPAS